MSLKRIASDFTAEGSRKETNSCWGTRPLAPETERTVVGLLEMWGDEEWGNHTARGEVGGGVNVALEKAVAEKSRTHDGCLSGAELRCDSVMLCCGQDGLPYALWRNCGLSEASGMETMDDATWVQPPIAVKKSTFWMSSFLIYSFV